MDAPKRGRPKKVQEEEVEILESQPEALVESVISSQILDLKHVFRVISISGLFLEGYDVHPANVIEDLLRQNYFAQGYMLLHVELVRVVLNTEEQPIGHEIMYVLVKYAE